MLQLSGLGWPARSAGPLFRGAARSAVIAASCATVLIHGTKGRDHFLGVIYERPMTSELFLGRKTFSSNAAKTVSEQPGYTPSANWNGVARRRGMTVVPPSDSHGADN
jgi:hypothetical protein